MSSKSEIPALLAALGITAGLLGGGYWWFTRQSNFNLGTVLGNASTPAPTGTVSPAPSPSPAQTPAPTPNPPTQTNNSPGNTFAAVQSVPNGLFSYGGSTTWAPIRKEVDGMIQQAHPDFRLRYTDPPNQAPGSGVGIAMVVDKQLAFSQSSRSLKPEEIERAKQQGYEGLSALPVALEGLAVAVPPELSVDSLTIDQLKDIYLGNLTNWNQVGGPNLPISPISRAETGGTVDFFKEFVLGGAEFGQTVQFIGTTTEALRAVSNTPGAIYYASAPEVVGQCTVKPLALGRTGETPVRPYEGSYVPPENCPAQRNQPNTAAFASGDYPLTRSLFVIVRQDGSIEQQAGEAYAQLLLTDEGQRLIESAGFVRIR